jgi:hypothetical protein
MGENQQCCLKCGKRQGLQGVAVPLGRKTFLLFYLCTKCGNVDIEELQEMIKWYIEKEGPQCKDVRVFVVPLNVSLTKALSRYSSSSLTPSLLTTLIDNYICLSFQNSREPLNFSDDEVAKVANVRGLHQDDDIIWTSGDTGLFHSHYPGCLSSI